ncbi:hypothetical protein IWX76_000605 [Pedobacter sp. CAN_A7]|uniref:hypothetical protein n=1 Tax=Pedobacter sp. CAN_A7 TaxID=2787722 RepID=UPI0018CB870C
MKKLCILLFVFSLVYLSCKKDEDAPGEIYGKWKLTETMNDPGDGSGKYIKVKGDPKYLTVDRSGKMSGDAVPDLHSLKIIDSVRIEVINSNAKEPLVYRYKVSASSLTLHPPCIEGCGIRFVRN